MKIKSLFLLYICAAFLLFPAVLMYSCAAADETAGITEAVTEAQPEQTKTYRKNTLIAGTKDAGKTFSKESEVTNSNAEHGLQQFLLTTELNPDLPFNVCCNISNNAVSALIPAGIDLTAIKIQFKYSGKSLKVNGEELISRESVLNLTEPAELIITSESGTEFTVTLNIETLNTGLPSIALTTDDYKTINSKTEYNACTFYTGGGDNTICPYADNEITFVRGTVKGRGNTSWGFPKKSYTVKFDDKVGLLDLPASKNWTLISNYQDKTLLRNDFASKLSDAVGLSANMKTRSVDFWLNGKYWGTYLLTEKIEIESGRVDITDFKEGLPPDKVSYLFEWDGHIQEIPDLQRKSWETIENVIYDPAQDAYFINTTGWLVIHKPSSSDITPGHLRYIYGYITEIESALEKGDYETVSRRMDLESFVQWYLVEDIMKNMDAGFWSSCYMYLDSSGVLHMGPVWDFDMSLGNCNYGGCDTPDGDYVSQTWYYSHLFGMPEFRALAKKIWSEKYEAILGMKDYTVKTAQMLEKSLTLNFRVWNILGHGVGSNPKNIADAETYSEQIDIMLDFFDRRINFVGSYIDSLK